MQQTLSGKKSFFIINYTTVLLVMISYISDRDVTDFFKQVQGNGESNRENKEVIN